MFSGVRIGGRRVRLGQWVAPFGSSGPLGFGGFSGLRPGVVRVRSWSLGSVGCALMFRSGSLGSVECALRVVGFAWGRWVHWGSL